MCPAPTIKVNQLCLTLYMLYYISSVGEKETPTNQSLAARTWLTQRLNYGRLQFFPNPKQKIAKWKGKVSAFRKSSLSFHLPHCFYRYLTDASVFRGAKCVDFQMFAPDTWAVGRFSSCTIRHRPYEKLWFRHRARPPPLATVKF